MGRHDPRPLGAPDLMRHSRWEGEIPPLGGLQAEGIPLRGAVKEPQSLQCRRSQVIWGGQEEQATSRIKIASLGVAPTTCGAARQCRSHGSALQPLPGGGPASTQAETGPLLIRAVWECGCHCCPPLAPLLLPEGLPAPPSKAGPHPALQQPSGSTWLPSVRPGRILLCLAPGHTAVLRGRD